MPALETPPANTGWKAPDFRLKGTDGQVYALKEARGPKGLLVMFICNHCPFVQAIADKIAADTKALAELGIGSIAIMSNDTDNYPEDSFDNMIRFKKQHGFGFPYVIDETQSVAKAYGAVCTPDFFGFDAELKLQYRGRLDASGMQRKTGGKRELFEAMRQLAQTGQGPGGANAQHRLLDQMARRGMSIRLDAHCAAGDLKAGNTRFLEGKSVQDSKSSLKKLKDFAERGQVPKAIILCCSDSRAPVEMIFDQDIGDLFVIRVAGNIIAPSLVGSIEFAASAFGTQLVLVMGHTQCGAVTATLDHIADAQTIPSENIHDIVSRIRPHIFAIAQRQDLSHHEKLDKAVEANVRASVGQLEHSSRLIEGLVSQGKMTILGAVLDLATGQVHFLK